MEYTKITSKSRDICVSSPLSQTASILNAADFTIVIVAYSQASTPSVIWEMLM